MISTVIITNTKGSFKLKEPFVFVFFYFTIFCLLVIYR